MITSAFIPEDELMLDSTIEAEASLDALAKGNKKILDKRKGGSICIEYYRKRRRIHSESFNTPDINFFDKCKKLQDHATLNHQAQVGDVMFSDCLANNFGSIATTDLVDKSAHKCRESVQNDCINSSMREDGLCKLNENVCFLRRDNLMSFFDLGIEPKDESDMHNGDSDDSSAVTEVEFASLLSFSSKDYIHCVLNTEDTIDDIPDSQLLDSDEDVLEDSSIHGDQQDVCDCEDDSFHGDQPDVCRCEDNSFDGDQQDVCHSEDDSIHCDQQDVCHCEDDSFHGDQQDVCHCEDDVESTSFSHLDPVHLNEGETICILNTEDPEIPCNDNIFLLIHPSPSATPQTDTESIDLESSFTQSQMDGPDLSPGIDSANPHVGNTLKSVSMDHNLSISDHNDPDSDSDLCFFPDIEDAIPSPSVRSQTVTNSIEPASCFTQLQMDGPDLSTEFNYANPHVGCTPKSVSVDHNSCISDHNSDSDLPCFIDIEDPELLSASIRLQTAIDSIDLASCFTDSPIVGPDLSKEFDYANPHVGCTLESVSLDHNSCISEHNSYYDLPCFLDIEDPEIPSVSVRPQTAMVSIDLASSITHLQIDGPDLSSEFDSAHPHVGKYVSVDHDLFISDNNNSESDSDSDLPCFPDIDALILKLYFEYAQESWISNEVKRGKNIPYKRSITRLERASSKRAMSSLGAFAVFYGHHFNYYIKKIEVTIGRSTDDTEVDIDLRKESHANMISRQQATITMENDGTFTLKNIGKGLILMNGISVAHGQVAALGSSCLLQIRGMDFMFEMNDRYVRWYLDNITKKTQGKFTTFEWSVN